MTTRSEKGVVRLTLRVVAVTSLFETPQREFVRPEVRALSRSGATVPRPSARPPGFPSRNGLAQWQAISMETGTSPAVAHEVELSTHPARFPLS